MLDRLKQQFADDGCCTVCWVGLRDPQFVGMLAQQSYDGVVLDTQHGFHDELSVLDAIPLVVMAGKSPLVRVPVRRWDAVERVLDHGALGVIAPMINTREDAELFAKAAKYPPIGSRSHGPRHAATLYGLDADEYLKKASENTLALAQIETLEAYENLDDIIGTDGIDGVLMGPSDFSISVRGKPEPEVYGPDTIELVKDIAVRSRKAGKIAAGFTLTAEQANQLHSFGYRLISLATDSGIVSKGADASFEGLDFT